MMRLIVSRKKRHAILRERDADIRAHITLLLSPF